MNNYSFFHDIVIMQLENHAVNILHRKSVVKRFLKLYIIYKYSQEINGFILAKRKFGVGR